MLEENEAQILVLFLPYYQYHYELKYATLDRLNYASLSS